MQVHKPYALHRPLPKDNGQGTIPGPMVRSSVILFRK